MTVVFAILLLIIFGFFALSVDTAYLYTEKNRLQNALEAAALAGTEVLCDTNLDPLLVARQIAEANGVSSDLAYDSDAMVVELGFYETSEDLFYPEGATDLYNNAVRVSLTVDEKLLLPGFVSEESTTPLTVSSVAYRERFGLFAEEDIEVSDDEDGEEWVDGYPVLEDMGIIFANGDLVFDTDPTISEEELPRTILAAVGESPQGITVERKVDLPPIDWDELLDAAQNNGKVMTWDDVTDETVEDVFGNQYIRSAIDMIDFFIADGDHNGRTYYFDVGTGRHVRIKTVETGGVNNVYNCTIVSTGGVQLATSSGTWMELGGTETETVYICCNSFMIPGYEVPIPPSVQLNGVVLRADDFISLTVGTGDSSVYPVRTLYLTATAGSWIHLYASTGLGDKWVVYNGYFGPPCGGPVILRLGEDRLAE